MKIRDRVKELRRVKASELRPNPNNWRTHPDGQKDAIRGVLAEIGFAGAELARELPDGSLMLIDGHARAEIVGDAEVPVLILDVDEAEADKLLATFDPIGAMAGANAAALDELLRNVETGNQALADMLTELAEANGLLGNEGEEDSGIKGELEISPELHERQDYIVVVCDNEFDWLVLCQKLDIKTVKSGKVETSTIEKTGVGRVVTAASLLRAMNND